MLQIIKNNNNNIVGYKSPARTNSAQHNSRTKTYIHIDMMGYKSPARTNSAQYTNKEQTIKSGLTPLSRAVLPAQTRRLQPHHRSIHAARSGWRVVGTACLDCLNYHGVWYCGVLPGLPDRHGVVLFGLAPPQTGSLQLQSLSGVLFCC